MREQFIPYKQALELRDLGFDEKCLVTESKVGYARNPSTDMEELPIQEPFYWMNSKIHTDNCTLPLWQQAFDWFREKHNILGNVYANASGYLFEWHDAEGGTHRGDSDFDGPNDGGVWDTYQEAREALLIRLISIIKKS